MLDDPLFSTVMSTLFPRTRFIPRPQLTASYDVDVVLGDCIGVSNQESYWKARPVPYLLVGGVEGSTGISHSPLGHGRVTHNRSNILIWEAALMASIGSF